MKTKKLYDLDAYKTEFEAVVLSCIKQEDASMMEQDGVSNDVLYEVILDQTLFFPEEGGQTPDKGILGDIEVLDVQIEQDVIKHYVGAPLEVTAKITGKIDWQHRFFNMQQHSGEHLFSGLVYRKYGLKNVGFHLSNQIVTMDFDKALTEAQLKEMEWAVNEAITANARIYTSYPTKEELAELEYRSKLELEGDIRIVEISGYDICACCAPHVQRTGEIGIFKIQSVQNYKGGMRISFLCGFRALEEYRRKSEIISELSQIMTTNQDNLADHINKLKAQIQSLKTQLSHTKQVWMESKLTEIPSEQKDVLLFEEDLEVPVMRAIVNQLVEKHEGICGVFTGTEADGYNFIIGSRSMDCREAVKKMKDELGARGGGSTQMAQGSVSASKEEIINLYIN